MSEQIFDIVETENQVYTCVVDYISKRQVIIYDLTPETDHIFRLIVINWKLSFFHLRFAVFKELYFPTVPMPNPIILNINSIVYSTKDLSPTKPKRTVMRSTILSEQSCPEHS